jgi:hypothetical protein
MEKAPSPPERRGRFAPLAVFGSPAARLAWVLVISGGIIGGVYLVSGIETKETAAPRQAEPVASTAAADTVIDPDDLPGFEIAHLTDQQKLWLYHKAHLEQCSCDCGMSVAQCRVVDPTCPVSPGRARELVEEAAGTDG